MSGLKHILNLLQFCKRLICDISHGTWYFNQCSVSRATGSCTYIFYKTATLFTVKIDWNFVEVMPCLLFS